MKTIEEIEQLVADIEDTCRELAATQLLEGDSNAARVVRLEYDSALIALDGEITKARAELHAYFEAQRDFNIQSWRYRIWNRRIKDAPVREWDRRIAAVRGVLESLKKHRA